jgi:uncharacterized protein YkwD
MRVKLAQIAVAGALALSLAAPLSARAAGPADDAVLAEMNYARTYPQAYAMRLLLQPVSDWEQSLGAGYAAQDPDALAEAIAFLLRQAPLPPLKADQRLAASALEHVAEQGARGAVGHDGPGGEAFDRRIRRYGVAEPYAAENIAYGPGEAADVVRELIIDSGVPSRGHRHNIFFAPLQVVGVSCGPHRQYANMCVMDFAGGQVPLRTAQAAERETASGF